MRLISNGAYDVMKVAYVDTKGGWLYVYASPENAAQMFLWRLRLDGSGEPERVTPRSARGTHEYDVGPHARWAIHTGSSWGTPPATDLVRLPSHQVVRVLLSNDKVAKTLESIRKGSTEFFQ